MQGRKVIKRPICGRKTKQKLRRIERFEKASMWEKQRIEKAQMKGKKALKGPNVGKQITEKA